MYELLEFQASSLEGLQHPCQEKGHMRFVLECFQPLGIDLGTGQAHKACHVLWN